MILLYLIPFILLFIPFPRYAGPNSCFNDDYISHTQTLPIKGLFVILVFFRHSNDYIATTSNLDILFRVIDYNLDQLIVTLFLFYSGFGIYNSIKTKEEKYILSLPFRRLFKVWGHFSICIMLFLLYDLLTKKKFPIKRILLSFIGWDSIGNSNWFMFVTFVMYVLVFVSFFFCRRSHLHGIVLFSLLSIVLIVLLSFFKQPYWYNTVICFTTGMWFCRYKDKIQVFLFKKNKYNVAFLSLLLVFLLSSLLRKALVDDFWNIMLFSLIAIQFSLLVILITMKYKVSNRFLYFIGKHVFSIYMLQRLVFMFFSSKINNKYVYFIICFIVTLTISIAFNYLMNKLDNLIINKIPEKLSNNHK